MAPLGPIRFALARRATWVRAYMEKTLLQNRSFASVPFAKTLNGTDLLRWRAGIARRMQKKRGDDAVAGRRSGRKQLKGLGAAARCAARCAVDGLRAPDGMVYLTAVAARPGVSPRSRAMSLPAVARPWTTTAFACRVTVAAVDRPISAWLKGHSGGLAAAGTDHRRTL